MLPTARPVIWVVVLAIGCPLGIGASSAQAQVLGSVSPAPVYSYRLPVARRIPGIVPPKSGLSDYNLRVVHDIK